MSQLARLPPGRAPSANMGILHYDVTQGAALATTAGSPEAIGTGITLPSNTEAFHGLYLQCPGDGTTTAAQAGTAFFLMNLESLAKKQLKVHSPRSFGGAPATNIDAKAHPGMWYPFVPQSTGVLPNEKLDFLLDVHAPDPTGEFSAQVFTMTSNKEIDKNVLRNMSYGTTRPISMGLGFSDTEDGTISAGNTSIAFPNAIRVPFTWVRGLHTIGITVAHKEQYTQTEILMGYVELTGSYPDIAPMKIPFCAVEASLGTPVGSTSDGYYQMFMPLHLPSTGKNEDVDITVNITLAQTGDIGCAVTLYGWG